MEIRLTQAQKAALKALFARNCLHCRESADGEIRVCGLKEYKERCEYSTWKTWTDCPTDCPHHLMRTKVTCTPDNCTLAEKFVKEIREVLKQDKA